MVNKKFIWSYYEVDNCHSSLGSNPDSFKNSVHVRHMQKGSVNTFLPIKNYCKYWKNSFSRQVIVILLFWQNPCFALLYVPPFWFINIFLFSSRKLSTKCDENHLCYIGEGGGVGHTVYHGFTHRRCIAEVILVNLWYSDSFWNPFTKEDGHLTLPLCKGGDNNEPSFWAISSMSSAKKCAKNQCGNSARVGAAWIVNDRRLWPLANKSSPALAENLQLLDLAAIRCCCCKFAPFCNSGRAIYSFYPLSPTRH
jgi:hypothetical protein